MKLNEYLFGEFPTIFNYNILDKEYCYFNFEHKVMRFTIDILQPYWVEVFKSDKISPYKFTEWLGEYWLETFNYKITIYFTPYLPIK